MRLRPFLLAAFVLALALPAPAAEWIEYVSRVDFFSVNFPAQPDVRDIQYETEYGLMLPARVYSAADGPNRYSVTAVDFSTAEALHTARSKACTGYPDVCGNRTRADLRGAMDNAAGRLLTRAARVTDYGYYNADLVEGRRLQLVNADGTQTFAAINMHANRLFIFEGTVAPGSPPPSLFQQSVGFVDTDGNRIRYAEIYSNAYPAPPRTR
ncbi:MAG: hypothetical protein HY824_04410 [Acidobacteria bacterium]|nr:hypothetical protein [Acidobacteriota bacterium]